MIDPLAAIRVLLDHDVRFLLVGGQASRARGSSTATKGVDICYDRAPDNLDRLAAALDATHARPRGAADDVPFVLDARALRDAELRRS